MKKTIAIATLAFLSACAQPIHMVNKETGQHVTCKGSVSAAIFGGATLHRVTRNNCVRQMEQVGFKRT